jgi:hypothetical protein
MFATCREVRMSECRKWLSVLVTAMLPLSAIAADGTPKRVLLWRDLYAGMTKTEVKALYPQFTAAIAPNCSVRVLSTYKAKQLVSVILLGNDARTACSTRLADELKREYGEGSVERSTQSSMPIAAGGSVSQTEFERLDIVWKAEGKSVRLALMPGKPRAYNLIFTTRTDGKLY